MSLKDRRLWFRPLAWGIMLFVLLVSLSACWRVENTKQPEYSQIDPSEARTLSDATAADLIADRRKDLHKRLEESFRETVTTDDVDAMVGHLVEGYGKAVNFEFKQDEVGRKSYLDGSNKPMRKFWYAAATTKFNEGSHFLVIEVVPDGDGLAVSSFAYVNFPLGVPENLR